MNKVPTNLFNRRSCINIFRIEKIIYTTVAIEPSMGEDFDELRKNQKELYKQVLEFRDYIGTNRAGSLYTAFLFLKVPFRNFDIYDIGFRTKQNTQAVRLQVRRFMKEGLLKDTLGLAERKIIYHLPANRYRELLVWFLDSFFVYTYGWRNDKKKRLWVWEHWYMFQDIIDRVPMDIHKYRVEFNNKNSLHENERRAYELLLEEDKPSTTK